MELKDVKRKRKTRVKTIEDLFKEINENRDISQDEILINLETISEWILEIKGLNEKIDTLLTEAQVEDDVYTSHTVESDKIIKEAKLIKLSIEKNVNEQKRSNNQKSSDIKLPTIDIKGFWGDRKDYYSFIQRFDPIHKNETISKSSKLQYLISLLKGNAARLVEGFQLSDENYDNALELLAKKYGDVEIIKCDLMRDLFNVQIKDDQPKMLQNVCIDVMKLLRQLHALGFDTQTDGIQRLYAQFIINQLPQSVDNRIKNYSYDEYKTLRVDKLLDLIDRAANETDTGKNREEKFKDHKKNKPSYERYQKSTAMTAAVNDYVCNLCQGSHKFWHCEQYDTHEKRIKRAKELKLCTACLKKTHIRQNCSAKICERCKIPGHLVAECRRTAKDVDALIVSTATTANQTGGIALPIMTIDLHHQGKTVSVTALIDQGSQRSFIRRDVIRKLELKSDDTEVIRISGFGNPGKTTTYDIVSIPTERTFGVDFKVIVADDKLPEYVDAKGLAHTTKYLQTKGLQLAGKDPSDTNRIEMLIGSDYYSQVVTSVEKIDDISILRTPTGIVPFGPMLTSRTQLEAEKDVVSLLTLEDPAPEEDIRFLWSLDSIGICEEEMHPDEKNAIQKFEDGIKYDGNKYIARLPWKKDPAILPTNLAIAKTMLKSSLERLRLNPEKLGVYDKIIKTQLSEDFIEQVQEDEISEKCHYLVHHSVAKDSPTTPLRIVFNCSFRGKHSVSLNDCLYKGPNLLPEMLQVLMRFRLDEYAVISDIKKAFLQVGLHEEDRNYTRFLWPEDPMNPESKYLEYRYKNVLFGSTASQFLLNAVVQKHLNDVPQMCSEQLIRNIYVDNIMATHNSTEALKKFSSDSTEVMARANLPLVAWASNDPTIVDHIDSIKRDERKIIPVLGLLWNTETDTLSISHSPLELTNPTKRKVLSGLAAQFDPIGFFTPILVHAKFLMRDLHKDKYDWDTVIDDRNIQRWKDFSEECAKLSDIKIPRSEITKGAVTLHAFSDASKQAYGAVIYAVQNNKIQFVASKSKLAPQKELSIPKLELTALLLSSRLVNYCEKTYSDEWEIQEIHMHTDSLVANGWVTSHKNVPTYVENRRVEIRKNVPHAYLHHIEGKSNPADLLSRGTIVAKLKDNSLWWKGPEELNNNRDVRIGDHIVAANILNQSNENNVILSIIEKCGSYDKALRIVAYVKRFGTFRNRKNGALDAIELDEAERTLIKGIQKATMEKELKYLTDKKGNIPDLVKDLNLQLENGVIVVLTRLQNSDASARQKRPYFIPQVSNIQSLLIRHCHEMILHAGVNSTLAQLQQRYYITKPRQRVKSTLRKCVQCKREHGNHYHYPINSQLPKVRITRSKPFECTGVDYCGPFLCKNADGIMKRYISLFTCAVTRAIHLEIANDLSATEFLATFQRFVARRGYPSVMISDNATNYLKSSQMLAKSEATVLKIDVTSELKCIWHFIPARTPWFGGFYERLIGLVKSTLRKSVGKALLTDSEFSTILCKIESCLNDRPLTYVSEGENYDILTPSNLMSGFRLNTYPEIFPDVTEITDPSIIVDNKELTRRQKYLSSILGKFWQKWSNEYLPSLKISQKSKGGIIIPKIGDIVLLDNDGKRISWPLGRIVELVYGKNKSIRTVKVKTKAATVERPVNKIYPLEISSEIQSVSETAEDGEMSSDVTTSPLPDIQPQHRRSAAIRARELISNQFLSPGEDVETN